MADWLIDTDGVRYWVVDPSDVDGYGWDLTTDSWLATGETVDSVVWTVPAGLTKVTAYPNYTSGEYNTGGYIKVALTGGTDGTDYDVLAHWVTSTGRERDRTFRLKVQEQ